MNRPKHLYKERPYRIWDNQTQKTVHRRYYVEEHRAHDAATRIAHWDLKVSESVTVYTIRNPGKDLGTYVRRVKGIEIPTDAKGRPKGRLNDKE